MCEFHEFSLVRSFIIAFPSISQVFNYDPKMIFFFLFFHFFFHILKFYKNNNKLGFHLEYIKNKI